MKFYIIDLWINRYSLHGHVITGLLAPVDVTAKVNGDKVRVQWKDNNQPELVAAVYIAVSKVNDGKPNSAAFIHAEDHSTKSITLFGLIPQMTYSIRVCI